MNRSKKIARFIGIVVLIAVLVVGGWAVVQVSNLLKNHAHGEGPKGVTNAVEGISALNEIWNNPYAGFPGKSKVVILGMGIDDNWTNSDEVYTAGARTDTLFFLTLDLKNKRATMLSIPRDTYTHIAGTDHSTKINAAYASGGPQRAIATVAEMTGVRADHYLLLNINATKKMVDALGGVDVDVPHEMHYHDKWGHLSIDLYPGQQHLNGDQAVGFVRYRHPDAGGKPTPEDGDERRMARQHILLRDMVTQAKSFMNLEKIGSLADTAMSQIQTDMTKTQLLDLASIYRDVKPDNIQTASMPGTDFHSPGGSWDYKLDPVKMKALVDWLVRGNDSAARGVVTVIVRNGTGVHGLAARAADYLRSQGYSDVVIVPGRPTSTVNLASQTAADQPTTTINDSGVSYTGAISDVQTLLGLPAAIDSKVPNKPNHRGWTAPAAITVTLGADYARQSNAAGVVADNRIPAAP